MFLAVAVLVREVVKAASRGCELLYEKLSVPKVLRTARFSIFCRRETLTIHQVTLAVVHFKSTYN